MWVYAIVLKLRTALMSCTNSLNDLLKARTLENKTVEEESKEDRSSCIEVLNWMEELLYLEQSFNYSYWVILCK